MRKGFIFGVLFLIVLMSGIVLAEEVVLNPEKDAWIESANPDLNYGSSTNLITGFNGAGNDQKTFIRFAITDLPAGAEIIRANLSLYARFGPDENKAKNYLRRVLTEWDEENITWDNQPIYEESTDNFAFIEEGFDMIWIDFNVTEDVIDFIINGTDNFGWVIEESFVDLRDVDVKYWSREHPNVSFRPYLFVEYDVPGEANFNRGAGVDLTDMIDTFQVELINPSGIYTSQTIPIEFSVIGTNNYSCYYNVTLGLGELFIGETEIVNCENGVFSVGSSGDYRFNLKVFSSIGGQVIKSSDFSVSLPVQEIAEELSNTGSRGGDGGCSTVWIAEEWSECFEGVQARSVGKEKESCWARLSEKPAETRECGGALSNSEAEEDANLFSLIVGAVIGQDGQPRPLGVVLILAVVVGAFFGSLRLRAKYSKR